MAMLAVSTVRAGDMQLKPETLQAWDEYVHAASARRFLWADENPRRAARLRAGEIVVAPGSEMNPRRVPYGLIYDWVGAAFFPERSHDAMLPVVRDYSRYKELYKPDVIEAKLLRQTGLEDEFEMRLHVLSVFKKSALDGVYASSYFRVDATRWYSITTTSHIQEIEEYGGPKERRLAVDTGNGFLAVMRYPLRGAGRRRVLCHGSDRAAVNCLRLFPDPGSDHPS